MSNNQLLDPNAPVPSNRPRNEEPRRNNMRVWLIVGGIILAIGVVAFIGSALGARTAPTPVVIVQTETPLPTTQAPTLAITSTANAQAVNPATETPQSPTQAPTRVVTTQAPTAIPQATNTVPATVAPTHEVRFMSGNELLVGVRRVGNSLEFSFDEALTLFLDNGTNAAGTVSNGIRTVRATPRQDINVFYVMVAATANDSMGVILYNAVTGHIAFHIYVPSFNVTSVEMATGEAQLGDWNAPQDVNAEWFLSQMFPVNGWGTLGTITLAPHLPGSPDVPGADVIFVRNW